MVPGWEKATQCRSNNRIRILTVEEMVIPEPVTERLGFGRGHLASRELAFGGC